MKRLLCWFGWHRPMPGCSRQRALVYVCATCGSLERGEMAVRR